MGHALHVSVPFFFDGAPQIAGRARKGAAKAPLPAYVFDFVSTFDGLALVTAFTQIGGSELRHSIVRLIEAIARESER